MRHAEKLKAFNKQAAAAVKVFKKAGLPQSFINKFVAITKKIGGDVVSDRDAIVENGLLHALGDRGLDDLAEGIEDLTEKYAEELFAADLTEVESQPSICEVFWPAVSWWEKS